MKTISSITIFENTTTYDRPTFTINHPKENGRFDKTDIKLTRIESLTGKHIIDTHPEGQATTKSALCKRATRTNQMMNTKGGKCYTGIKKTSYGSITVDVIINDNQVVASILDTDGKVNNNVWTHVSFERMEANAKGIYYTTKKFSRNASDLNGVVLEGEPDSEILTLERDIAELMVKLAAKKNARSMQNIANKAVALYAEIHEESQDKQAETEIAALNAIDNSRDIESDFDRQLQQFAREEANHMIAPETDHLISVDDEEVESRKVLADESEEEPRLKLMDSIEAEHTEQPNQTIKSRAQLNAEATPAPIKRTPTGTKADPMIVDGKHVTICPELEGTIPFALSTFDSAEVDFLVTGSGRAVAARFDRPLEESTQWIATQIKSNPFFAHAIIVTKTGEYDDLISYREAVRAAARVFACEHAYLCPQKTTRAHRGTEWGKALSHEIECSQEPLIDVEERIEIGGWYEA